MCCRTHDRSDFFTIPVKTRHLLTLKVKAKNGIIFKVKSDVPNRKNA
jgi:hypothetical protein